MAEKPKGIDSTIKARFKILRQAHLQVFAHLLLDYGNKFLKYKEDFDEYIRVAEAYFGDNGILLHNSDIRRLLPNNKWAVLMEEYGKTEDEPSDSLDDPFSQVHAEIHQDVDDELRGKLKN